MSITLNLNNDDGVGTTYETSPTPVYLFPAAALATSRVDTDAIDSVSVKIATHTSTMTLSLDPKATQLAAANNITVAYNATTGVLTLFGADQSDSVWQSLLRGVQFSDSSATPVDPGSVTVTATNSYYSFPFIVTDTGTDIQNLHRDLAPVNRFEMTHTNADQFADSSYDLNTGTDNWQSNWTESDDGKASTGPSKGDIQISSGALTFKDSDGDSQSIQREAAANLAGATSAKLTFDYTSNTNGSNENVTVEISKDGGSTWTSIGTIGANGADGKFTADISAYASDETYIRFTVPGSLDSGEAITIDNVRLSYTTFDTTTLPKQTVNFVTNPHVVFSAANGNEIKVSDANDSNVTVTLTVPHGTLTLVGVDNNVLNAAAGLTVTGNGSASVVISGPVAAINNALNGLDYHTSSTDKVAGNVDDTLTIKTSDGHTGGVDTDAVQIDVICFYPGTMVRTPSGEVAVEMLQRGDLVSSADGRDLPVSWIGRQTVSTVFADKLRVLPIRIKSGALGDNVPCRDLLVSPDHALLVGGALIQAGALVNGSSIVREQNVPSVFTYYHVEVDDHSLILAENTPAETFVDNIERLAFDNWAEHEALYPVGKPITELPYPRAKSHRQVPVATRAMLAARACQIGLAGDEAAVA